MSIYLKNFQMTLEKQKIFSNLLKMRVSIDQVLNALLELEYWQLVIIFISN